MKIDKNLLFSNLFSIYKALLPEKQKEVLMLFYFDNIGISEIAEMKNITRQAVKDSLLKGEKALENFESSLNIYSKFQKLESFANKKLTNEQKEELFSILEKGDN